MSTLTAPPVSCPEPGFYPGVAFDDYFRWPAAYHSLLCKFRQTAAHAREYLLHKREPTAQQALGWATHVAVLEPDRFDMEFVKAPKVDKRTNVGKSEWAAFELAHAGKSLLKADEYQFCLDMRDAVWRHPTAAEFLKSAGYAELSMLAIDEETGRPMKGRIDRLGSIGGWPILGDLKTTNDASRKAFERTIHRYAYHEQAALYLDVAAALKPFERKFVWLAVETDPPHCVALYEIEDAALSMGRDAYRKHLGTLIECEAAGSWPGYPDGIDYAGLPAWAYKGFEE